MEQQQGCLKEVNGETDQTAVIKCNQDTAKTPTNSAANKVCENEVLNNSIEKAHKQACLDFFCHSKVEGLPFSEPSSIAIETLLRVLGVNYRVIQKLKPTEQAFVVHCRKAYRGTLSVVDLIKDLSGPRLNEHLHDYELCLQRFATLTLENQTEFCLLYHRWIDQLKEWKQATAEYRRTSILRDMFYYSNAQRKIKIRLEILGFSTHTSESILSSLVRDLHALSVLLGDKDYAFGSKPSSLDCLMFSIVASFLYCTIDTNIRNIIIKNFANLRKHSERMRKEYWSDWDQVIGRSRRCQTPRFFFSFRRSQNQSQPKPDKNGFTTQEEKGLENESQQNQNQPEKLTQSSTDVRTNEKLRWKIYDKHLEDKQEEALESKQECEQAQESQLNEKDIKQK